MKVVLETPGETLRLETTSPPVKVMGCTFAFLVTLAATTLLLRYDWGPNWGPMGGVVQFGWIVVAVLGGVLLLSMIVGPPTLQLLDVRRTSGVIEAEFGTPGRCPGRTR